MPVKYGIEYHGYSEQREIAVIRAEQRSLISQELVADQKMASKKVQPQSLATVVIYSLFC